MCLYRCCSVHGSSAHSYERCFFTTRCNCKAYPLSLRECLRSRSRSSIILAFCKDTSIEGRPTGGPGGSGRGTGNPAT